MYEKYYEMVNHLFWSCIEALVIKVKLNSLNFFHIAKFSSVSQNQSKPPTLVHVCIALHSFKNRENLIMQVFVMEMQA